MSVPVVGFDLGSQSCYVSVARQGGIETVANEYSDRCTSTCVSFGEKSRFCGASAKQQAITNLKNTVTGFTLLLGKKFDDPAVCAIAQTLPYSIVETEHNRIGIQVQYLNETQVFTPEQIAAIQLSKLKEIAETNLNNKVTDCVINVPAHYTDSERRAMLDAAQIAGINCTRLLNDTTAAGINYGIYNKELPELDQKSKYVVIVDMGYSNLQVSIIAFNKGKMKVVATACDPALGGAHFDKVIFNEIVKEFRERYKLDVLQNKKAMVRLMTECEKLKKLMSANSTDIPMNIECFMEDKDVTARMNRTKFEELSAEMLERVESTMLRVLQEAQMKPEEMDSVELAGGSTRIPSIKQIISKVFQKDPRTTMNQDEAVARGCALQSAIFSPAFRVREFSITDACLYSISLTYEDPNSGRDTTEVFPKGHQVPSSRLLTFHRKEPFAVDAVYTHTKEIPNNCYTIGHFKVNNIVPTAEGESSKIKLKVRINLHGILNVSAQIMERYTKEVTEPETANIKEAPPKSKTSKDPTKEEDEGDKSNVNGTDDQAESSPEKMDTTSSPDDAANKESINEETSNEANGGKKTKVFTKPVDLPVVSEIFRFGKNKLNDFAETESKMIMQDKLERDRSLAKNNVEEYVYEMRDRLCGSYEPYVTEEEQASFQSSLAKTEDWLYDEGEDVGKQMYIDRLNELKKIGDRIVIRAKEAVDRPVAIEEFNKLCMHIQKVIQSYQAEEEQYNHLDKADVDKLISTLEEKQKWFTHDMSQQQAKSLKEDPILTASRIRMQKQSLESVAHPIITKSKPAPPPQKETTEKNGNAETGDSNVNNASADAPKSEEADSQDPTSRQTNCNNSEEASKDTGDMDID